MNSERQGDLGQSKVPVVTIVIGLVAAFVTAGAVSWATPDGNLVVTLVPAMVVGLAAFGIALWRFPSWPERLKALAILRRSQLGPKDWPQFTGMRGPWQIQSSRMAITA